MEPVGRFRRKLRTGLGAMKDPAQAERATRFLDLLDQGIWSARRNMINLSLPVGETETHTLVHAVGQFITRHRALLDVWAV